MIEPTDRFTGLAEIYASARPSYPDDAIEHIISTAGLKAKAAIADIGAGTGISSRLFALRGFDVTAVEPNDDMRLKGAAEGTIYGEAQIAFSEGDAEHTGLNDNSQDLVLAAQAFHWFKAHEALEEFYRIAKHGGWVALIWNERDESDALTAAYGDALRLGPETKTLETARQAAGQPLLQSKLFVRANKSSFSNLQVVDLDGFIRRAFSASYAPKDEPLAGQIRAALTESFNKFAVDGIAALKYTTSIYMAQKGNKNDSAD